MSNQKFQSFADVARCYDSIKPIRGRATDIRPLGNRRKDWERIIKISDTKYAFADGYTSFEQAATYAPIVWELHPDGTELVRIRNGLKSRYNTSRRAFLDNHLPFMMYLHRGKDLSISFGGNKFGSNRYVLPKNNSVNKVRELTFRVLPDNDGVSKPRYELIGTEYKPTRRKVTINKSEKEQYKNSINEYWKYYCTIAPMLTFDDWRYTLDMRSQVARLTAPEYRKIVADPDNELRLPLLFWIDRSGKIKGVTNKQELQKQRSTFMRAINNLLGFTTVTVED